MVWGTQSVLLPLAPDGLTATAPARGSWGPWNSDGGRLKNTETLGTLLKHRRSFLYGHPTFFVQPCGDALKNRACTSRAASSEAKFWPSRNQSEAVPAVTSGFHAQKALDWPNHQRMLHERGKFGCARDMSGRSARLNGVRSNAIGSPSSTPAAAGSAGSVLVWFKHDLRLDDHPGLTASLAADLVTPVFVFDPAIMKALPRSLLPTLLEAVKELRESLRALDSDLVIRWGRAGDVVPALARELGATEVAMEAEVEYAWQTAANGVTQALTVGAEATAVSTWSAPLHELEEATPVLGDFREYKRKRGPPIPPLDEPAALPPLPQGIDPGSIPSLQDLLSAVSTDARLEPYPRPEPEAEFERFVRAGGAEHALDLLRGYLRFCEPTSRSDWQEFYFYVYKAETRPGASFPNLFAPAAALGTLSLRRVYHEAIEFEKARGGGRLSPFGFSTFTATAAVSAAQAQEYHAELARRQALQETRRGHPVRYWRWRGLLAEYSTCGAGSEGEGPAVLLIHGFGAFWDHYRDNLGAIAQQGNRVWAVTMPGFGRSEKPLLSYTPRFWSEFVRDFIVEVVGEPVLLAGNSIGGYTVASVAGDWPELVTRLVLLNSAGRVVPDYTPPPSEAVARSNGFPRPLAWLFSRILFLYLQGNAARILQRCYPKAPDRADEALVSEIIRASHDPGAAEVVESAFYLPKPRPLNYLLTRYAGPVLVVQGKYDPLNDAPARAALLQACCSNATIELVEAGHCPHDEIPEQVSALVSQFARQVWTTDVAPQKELTPAAGEEAGGILDILQEEAAVAGPWTAGGPGGQDSSTQK